MFSSVSKMEDLEKIYYSPETGYVGINQLQRRLQEKGIKLSQKKLQNFLQQQITYTLHKPVKHKFPTRKVYVSGIDDQWQADLVDMIAFAKHNDDYQYILTVIDCLSKFLWALPLNTKSPKHVKKAFEKIFESSGRIPKKLQTDAGKEFYGKEMQEFLKKHNIHHFSSFSDKKASIVERVNRTLKERMWKYFTAQNSYRWIDVLDKLVEGYNTSFHRTIKMKPMDVNESNENQVWNNIYSSEKINSKKPKLKKGDLVRINKYKRKLFDKSYLPSWTEEIFRVTEVYNTSPTTYSLVDWNNETIEGRFYEAELQKVIDKGEYRIEKVIKTRTSKGKKEALVKWFGWPEKFNQWLPFESVHEI
jgi:transposase InsO family protein